MTRVAVVDDHDLLAQSMCLGLRAAGVDTTVVHPAPHEELLRSLAELRPDVVLLDLDLGSFGDATPLIAPLTSAGPAVVVVSGVVDRIRVASALEAGAVAYRPKSVDLARLVDTIDLVMSTDGPIDADDRVRLLTDLQRHRNEQARVLGPFLLLTDREQATLREFADGRSVAEIAQDWVVSEATVRTHVRGVLGKLDVRSQLAAVGAARRSGWLDDDVRVR